MLRFVTRPTDLVRGGGSVSAAAAPPDCLPSLGARGLCVRVSAPELLRINGHWLEACGAPPARSGEGPSRTASGHPECTPVKNQHGERAGDCDDFVLHRFPSDARLEDVVGHVSKDAEHCVSLVNEGRGPLGAGGVWAPRGESRALRPRPFSCSFGQCGGLTTPPPTTSAGLGGPPRGFVGERGPQLEKLLGTTRQNAEYRAFVPHIERDALFSVSVSSQEQDRGVCESVERQKPGKLNDVFASERNASQPHTTTLYERRFV
jgi:hypothetical protein